MKNSLLNRAHQRWADFHPLLRFMVVLALLGALGMLALRPAYRHFKSWRLDQNLKAAQVAVDESRMHEARDLSLTVLRSGDPRVDALRILQRASAFLRDPRHGDFSRALVGHPEGTAEDRLTGFRGIVDDLPLGSVGEAWASLGPELQSDPRFALDFHARLLAENRYGEAAAVLVAVPEEKRDGAVKRGLARVLIASGEAAGFDEAQRMIVAALQADGSEILEWVEVLEELPALSLREEILRPMHDLLAQAGELPPARVSLLLSRLEYAEKFDQRSRIIDDAIVKWGEAEPALVAAFLTDLGLYGRLVELIPVEQAAKSAELSRQLLAAMIYNGDWAGASRLLEVGSGMIEETELLAYRAIVAIRSGDKEVGSQPWANAIAAAGSTQTAHRLLTLHRIATEVGMPKEAETALVAAVLRGRGPLPLFSDLKGLLRSLELQGSEKVLMDICAVYLQIERGNPVLLTQYAYLSCLNDLADPRTVLEALEPLAKAYPGQLPIQVVLAVTHLLNSEPSAAADALAAMKWDPEQSPPAFRMTHYATEVLNGRMDKNDPRLVNFPWKSLLPSERKKFGELIRAGGM